jgi:hypothetical protein
MTTDEPKLDSLTAIWNDLTRDERRQAAEAFWLSDNVEQQGHAEQVLAQRLKFRPQSVHRMPVARKVDYLAGLLIPAVPEFLEATLIAWHLRHRRDMLAAFLDALGIPNEHGEINHDEHPAPPAPEALAAGRAAIAAQFPARDVHVYLSVLPLLDPVMWAGLRGG